MIEKYTVFDVETADARHSRICSIGIVRIEDGKIAWKENLLVDPECEMYYENVNVHHITQFMVAGQPVFSEIWNKYRDVFFDGIVVAHNASFDLYVLAKTLRSYGFPPPNVRYIDTMKIATCQYPDADNYQLTTVCNKLNICLKEHHNSGCDALATADILLALIDELGEEAVMEYESIFNAVSTEKAETEHSYKKQLSQSSLAIRELYDWIQYILPKGTMSEKEFTLVTKWLEAYEPVLGNEYPFAEIKACVRKILEDGIVEECEKVELLNYINSASDPVETRSAKFDGTLEGKVIVLSGKFDYGTKEDVANYLLSLGAKEVKDTSVTADTDIVLVGNNESKSWINQKYGRKVKRALELQDSGEKIEIMKEADVFSHL